MKREPPKPDLAKTMAMIDAAIAAGTHSKGSRDVCGGCNEWTSVIYHVTEQGKRLCPACADAAGCGPRQWDERQNRPAQSGARR